MYVNSALSVGERAHLRRCEAQTSPAAIGRSVEDEVGEGALLGEPRRVDTVGCVHIRWHVVRSVERALASPRPAAGS